MDTIRAAALGLEEEVEDFFRVLDVPCWPPEQRTEHRVMQFIQARQVTANPGPGLHKRKALAHKGPGLTALTLLNPPLQKSLELVYSRKFGIHAATGTDREVEDFQPLGQSFRVIPTPAG
jgi:hypothetical protein